MMNYNECDFITNFRGEYANDYFTHKEYVESGAWEKDYFSNWLDAYIASGEYPMLEDIENFCKTTNYYLNHWFDGVELGKIDPEAGVEE